MSDKISDEVFDTLPKKPNFLLVVLLSGAAILVIFAVALLFLTDTGKKLFPRRHQTSYMVPANSTSKSS